MALRQEGGLGNEFVLMRHAARSNSRLLAQEVARLALDEALPRDVALAIIRNLGLEVAREDDPTRYSIVPDEYEEVGEEEERARDPIVRVRSWEEPVVEHYVGEGVIRRVIPHG
ncbi:hypothetical protein GCM10007981_10150 [Thermocladium modestius]|uniref:Uncharacterized protein n=1 Tax=Thermocladium modestius TaxID=62609 RepID=A0A830GWQ2_9CREN|nr:hypothetical protein [Thermocladium modestius]GGP20762.1 hypothetical protein GCM10007981_10150 [Thermocladium modestius]